MYNHHIVFGTKPYNNKYLKGKHHFLQMIPTGKKGIIGGTLPIRRKSHFKAINTDNQLLPLSNSLHEKRNILK